MSPPPRSLPAALRAAALLVVALASTSFLARASGAPPILPISQLPMTILVPAHPQIVFAVANSQSMDGDLSGAILTGSGMLGNSYSPSNGYQQLSASSSPQSYTIPSGFTPPVNAGPGDGTAPYTVAAGGNLVDNSPSRLNVAKAGITAVLNTYMQGADFALVDYSTSSVSEYETWLYLMSPATGPFTFTNTPGLNRVVANPCYNWETISGNASSSCSTLQSFYAATGQDVNGSQYLVIGASSDDPNINDVLYAPAGGIASVCITYGGPTPATPYSAPYTLSTYESGAVTEFYSSSTSGCAGAQETGPTNAGYVPYAPQTMYVARGFGFYATQSASTANIAVRMTTAGATPTTVSVNNALAAFTPYLAPETSSSGTAEIKAAAVQSPIAGLLAGAQSYLQTNPSSSNGCNPQRYVVLVTDGLPTLDASGHNWPPLGSSSATGYGVTATFNADGSLNATNDQALTDAIAALQSLNARGIKTYVIGVGAGVDPAANPTAAATMRAMAVAGGTAAVSGTNGYFAATSPTDLVNDMQVILAQILQQSQATSAAAVNSTGLNTGTVIYQSQFVTSDVELDWTGELYAFPVNATTGQINTSPSNALWSAKHQLEAQNSNTDRVIATWDPNANGGQGGGTPFRWNADLAPAGISASTALGAALSTFPADTNGEDVLRYLRGSAAKEERRGGPFRNRSWRLGDIVNSAPLYVGRPNGSSYDPSYVAFAATYATRPPVVYVGANDGMLHAFDAATGNERFAFIPHGVWSNLVNLVNPYYNEQHHFYVDGSPQANDVKFSDNSWHTVVVTNEGAGGSTIFALDVTNPASLTTEAALSAATLWEFSDVDMGLSFSVPSIVNTNAGQLTFFGNGYDSPSSKPVLYAVSTQTGALVSKIDLCAAVASACNSSLANGLSSVTVVNTSGQLSQAQNMVYAGDLQGNLWRIDISGSSAASWTVSVLFQARDPGGNPQPITTPPAASLNPRFPSLLGTMVFVGTGELLSATDLTNSQIQTIYGVYDPPAGYGSPAERSSLVAQTLTSGSIASFSGGSEAVRYVSNNPVSLPTQSGWYVDLNLLDGERSITSPVIEAGGDLTMTTYYPNTSFCTGGGESWLMVLNYANGGSFASPQLDTYGNGTISSLDTGAGGLNPAAMSLGTVYATAPVALNAGSGRFLVISESGDTAATADSQPTDASIAQAGPGRERISWWEVR